MSLALKEMLTSSANHGLPDLRIFQRERVADATQEVVALKSMTGLSDASFKIGYAGNAMPVRLAVETRDWANAAQLLPI